MAVVRPKVFVAVKPFEVLGGGTYETGDVVAGADLAKVLRFGDAFVVPDRPVREVEVRPVDVPSETPEG